MQVNLLGKVRFRIRLAENARHDRQVLQDAGRHERYINWCLLSKLVLSWQRQHFALEEVNVGEDLRPLLPQSEKVLAVIHRDEEAARESEQRAEASESVLASEVCIEAHLGPHELLKLGDVLLCSRFVDQL